jgi:DnaJ-class molecular chaperone
MPNSSPDPCQECSGTGFVMVPEENQLVPDRCPMCGGSGLGTPGTRR